MPLSVLGRTVAFYEPNMDYVNANPWHEMKSALSAWFQQIERMSQAHPPLFQPSVNVSLENMYTEWWLNIVAYNDLLLC